MATAGDLVFQGTIDGTFKAFSATNGAELWSFDTRAPMIAPPITYQAGGRQYVTVLTGLGMAYPMNAAALGGPIMERYGLDPRTQARRVLTFVIGGRQTLPPRAVAPPPPDDPSFAPDSARLMPGALAYSAHCSNCHGSLATGAGQAPDLRRSAIPQDRAAFLQIVRNGTLQAQGMPKFGELSDTELDSIAYYIRAQSAQLRAGATSSSKDDPPSLQLR
jgi:quinohemoprotein ethanol dehydrogenase